MSVNTTRKVQREPDCTGGTGVEACELFELFGDEYTRRVYEAISKQPRSGHEVAEATDISGATAYRRLNDLHDAGLVHTEIVICEDGHHKERFRPASMSIELSLGAETGPAINVED